MKNFQTLIIGLLIFQIGITQNRPVVPAALRNVSVKMGKAEAETNNLKKDSKVAPIATDDETSIIGETFYDLQSMGGNQSRIYLYDDGTIGSVFTFGMEYIAFQDRGTGYNYYNGNEWGPEPLERIETEKTGYPSYSPWGENGEINIAHYSGASVEGLAIYERATKGTGAWSSFVLHGPNPQAELLWARSVTSGPDHSILHVIALTEPTSNDLKEYMGQETALLYSRSFDGGQTWDIQNTILPGTDSSFFLGFQPDTYEIAAKDNVVAILVGEYWTELFLLKSLDNGSNWTKTTIWNHPYPLHVSGTPTDTFYCADGAHCLAIDNNGKVHIAFGINRTLDDSVGTWWFPFVDGVGYWNEDMPAFSNNVNALSPYGDPGSELIENYNFIGWMQDINGNGTLDILGDPGYYYLGMSSMPQLVIDEQNRIYFIYSSVTETYNNGTQDYRHLWARASTDDGQTWSDFEDLNSDLIYIFSECVFPSCSPTSDEYIHLVFMEDNEPGLAVRGDLDPYGPNEIVYMQVGKYYNPQYGNLEGFVTDAQTGNPLQGALIDVSMTYYSGTSNASGYYFISGIPEGTYGVECSKSGYTTQTGAVNISGNNTAVKDFQLDVLNLAPPENLVVIMNNNDALLDWDEPTGSEELLGYNVYRNNVVIDNTTNTYYLDENVASGTYEYYVTAVYTEGESISSNHVIITSTSIKEINSDGISVFPNPVKDELNIISEKMIKSLSLFNSYGQSIVQEIINSRDHKIRTSDFSPGIYLLRIDIDDKTVTQRIVIN